VVVATGEDVCVWLVEDCVEDVRLVPLQLAYRYDLSKRKREEKRRKEGKREKEIVKERGERRRICFPPGLSSMRQMSTRSSSPLLTSKLWSPFEKDIVFTHA
jgi:hypothetical protein